MVSFTEAVKLFFRRYADFEGRSTRAEYWWVLLFTWLVYAVLGGIGLFFSADMFGYGEISPISWVFFGILIVFIFGTFIHNIALIVRRFHDLNQTGWLYLVFVIVGFFIGAFASLIMMIWFCFPGTKGHNKYGPDPFEDVHDIFG